MHDIIATQSTVLPEASTKLLPKEESRGIKGWLAGKYNRVYRALRPHVLETTDAADLREIREKALTPGDIDEHLELMFTEALLQRPQLVVELGVRGGVSTFVFERVAQRCGATIISVDVEDCSRTSSYEKWHFVRADDVAFAAQLRELCRQKGLPKEVDLLFVDTSHYYDHTVQEIEAWFPLLSERAKVILHDTNLRAVGPRRDGTFQLAWDNDRGVIRAIEGYLGIRLREGAPYQDVANGWLIRHWPNCNGLTILDRLPQ